MNPIGNRKQTLLPSSRDLLLPFPELCFTSFGKLQNYVRCHAAWRHHFHRLGLPLMLAFRLRIDPEFLREPIHRALLGLRQHLINGRAGMIALYFSECFCCIALEGFRPREPLFPEINPEW
jgi:hypothetical protein